MKAMRHLNYPYLYSASSFCSDGEKYCWMKAKKTWFIRVYHTEVHVVYSSVVFFCFFLLSTLTIRFNFRFRWNCHRWPNISFVLYLFGDQDTHWHPAATLCDFPWQWEVNKKFTGGRRARLTCWSLNSHCRFKAYNLDTLPTCMEMWKQEASILVGKFPDHSCLWENVCGWEGI